MIEYFKLSEMVDADPLIKGYVENIFSLATAEFKLVEEFQEDFNYFFGGPITVIESYKELSEVITNVEDSKGSRWLTILETPDVFDMAELYKDAYYILYTACTDSGGPTFFIPKKIAELCPNIEASVNLTKGSLNAD